MRTRTWIVAGLLAACALQAHHGSAPEERTASAPPRGVPRREAAADLRTGEAAGWPHAEAPPPRPPAGFAKLARALVDGVELDDGPSSEPNAPTADPYLDATSGRLAGTVRDNESGEELAGVTVIATSPSLPHTQVAITDERGDYTIAELPPGAYLLTFYYGDTTIERAGVSVDAGSTYREQLVLERQEPVQLVVHTFEETMCAATEPQSDPTGDEEDAGVLSGDP